MEAKHEFHARELPSNKYWMAGKEYTSSDDPARGILQQSVDGQHPLEVHVNNKSNGIPSEQQRIGNDT